MMHYLKGKIWDGTVLFLFKYTFCAQLKSTYRKSHEIRGFISNSALNGENEP